MSLLLSAPSACPCNVRKCILFEAAFSQRASCRRAMALCTVVHVIIARGSLKIGVHVQAPAARCAAFWFYHGPGGVAVSCQSGKDVRQSHMGQLPGAPHVTAGFMCDLVNTDTRALQCLLAQVAAGCSSLCWTSFATKRCVLMCAASGLCHSRSGDELRCNVAAEG